MWSFIKLLLLFIVATVCHWAFSSLFSFWGLSVNIMLAFTAAFCAVLKPAFGYSAAFVCGLFLDFFATKLFGYNAFSFTVASCVIYALAERFDFDGIFPQVISVFGLSVLVSVINALLVWWFASAAMWPGFWSVLGGAFFCALLAPAVFWIVRRVLACGPVCWQR